MMLILHSSRLDDTEKNMKEEHPYSKVLAESFCNDSITERDSQLSHGSCTRQDLSATTQPRSSYDVNNSNSKVTANQYDYSEPLNAPSRKPVNFQPNPSYGTADRIVSDAETTSEF